MMRILDGVVTIAACLVITAFPPWLLMRYCFSWLEPSLLIAVTASVTVFWSFGLYFSVAADENFNRIKIL